MRWGRRAHERQQQRQHASTVESTAEAEALAAAIEEARKGTAARHPALVVTPDKKAHAGAFVDGRFVEAPNSASGGRVARDPRRHEEDVAAGLVPGENPAMKDKRWVRR
jgi:hypothetical protein